MIRDSKDGLERELQQYVRSRPILPNTGRIQTVRMRNANNGKIAAINRLFNVDRTESVTAFDELGLVFVKLGEFRLIFVVELGKPLSDH